jgi:hypothetical protein
MEKHPKPFVWQMIREAVEVHGNKSSNIAIRDWICEHYPGTNVNTILNQIIVCTVNHESRVHYRENNRPRKCDEVYDFLFKTSPGKVEMYDSRIHGSWEIWQNEKGVLSVREIKTTNSVRRQNGVIETRYLDSAHLRAYLAKNLNNIEEGLELFVDMFGNDGVEYPTDFGAIDILAIDKSGAFIIIEIEADYSPDASSGEILKYRNWVKRHLAQGKPVRSYLLGAEIPEHVRYSLADCDDVFLKEYDLNIKLKDIPKISYSSVDECKAVLSELADVK